MTYSEAKKRANRKYNEKAYDRITLYVKKGDRDKIKAKAASVGVSANRFIVDLIEKNM